jgi:homoserine O-acetyltransferase
MADSPQQMASIGDLQLASGETLLHTQVGYRTAGTLNDDKSNVIVLVTWFTGTTADFFRWEKIGPGKLADTDHYFVIAVDALGNGVSSSPSNHPKQPGKHFPAITISDMVNSQYALLTEHLGITHARAVMGISMGGMQTFQWMGQYPGFMDKAIPIDGSPRMTSYDLLQWQTHESAIETMQAAGVENAKIMEFMSSLNQLTLWTPEYFVENISPQALPQFMVEAGQGYGELDANNYLTQLRAMMAQDVYARGSDSETPYLQKVQADVLVISAEDDHMVNSSPGKKASMALNEEYVEIKGTCGHMGTSCKTDQVDKLVNAFLVK